MRSMCKYSLLEPMETKVYHSHLLLESSYSSLYRSSLMNTWGEYKCVRESTYKRGDASLGKFEHVFEVFLQSTDTMNIWLYQSAVAA